MHLKIFGLKTALSLLIKIIPIYGRQLIRIFTSIVGIIVIVIARKIAQHQLRHLAAVIHKLLTMVH